MERRFLKKHLDFPLPNLIQVQLDSYNWFVGEGLKELFSEISPVRDWTGKELDLEFVDYHIEEPKYDEDTAKAKNVTYEAPLRAKIKLTRKRTNKSQEQEIYLGDLPMMTDRGTFIVNGIERVVVSQLVRSPGVFFNLQLVKGQRRFGAKIIPTRGAWLEMETDINGVIWVKIDRKRKVAVTSLLRAFGYSNDKDLREAFKDVDTNPEMKHIDATILKDGAKSQNEGYQEVYRRIRPGDLATVDNAKQLINAMFFNFERYDLGRVGRYKFNQRLGTDHPEVKEFRILRHEDLTAIVKEIIKLNNNPEAESDDIDHLGNRRVRLVGESVLERARVGFTRMEKIIKDRMSTYDIDTLIPVQLINARPLQAAIKEFFASSQLSQYMDQDNPLAELEHKRRVSAMGPGGLTRERAGFEVRDVHPSHYGRICPIQTPEGPNIGLVGSLASYSRINEYGFIEVPYRKVKNKKVTDEIVYLNALEEAQTVIAHASAPLDESGKFKEEKVVARIKSEPGVIDASSIEYMNVSPNEAISISTSLIPFLGHDDAQRALMGSNMQRQAVSCITSDSPVVGTGIEARVAADSGQVILAADDGIVKEVDARHIVVEYKTGKKGIYRLHSFSKSNAFTCINQQPRVNRNQKLKKGDVLADGASTDKGELALGQNLLVAFTPWEGYNYEDAIILSEKLVKRDIFSSIHIEDFSIDVRDTKLGPETITRDIPNVGEEKLKDLDEEGIIRIGAKVKSGDILVGKISPKGETDLTAEERLLRAIFGEKAKEVKDTSLTLPHGEHGKVVDVKIFSRDQGDRLPSGVIKTIQVSVAQWRKIAVGDKLAGRHGNKGVISRILPEEDLPYLEDGTRVDVVLNPLGVASRMNIGQILETHLGLAAQRLGFKVATPPLAGAGEKEIKELLKQSGLPEDGKMQLYDGRTGDPFKEKTTVGVIYIMKLEHLVEDKIHMRSTGPYSLITQQPLGGKAQFGGQRFGEMEVWALEGYGASYTLQEMLTIKSDDVVGRSKAYEAIIKGEEIKSPHLPASFHVLVNELKGLGLDVELLGVKREGNEKE